MRRSDDTTTATHATATTAPHEKARKGSDEAPRLKRKAYEQKLKRLHVELVKLQQWVQHEGLKVCVVFEGRDGAGKGGTIKAITERVSPRIFRVVAVPAPTEREKTEMYMQRYVEHLPAAGKCIFDDIFKEFLAAMAGAKLLAVQDAGQRFANFRGSGRMGVAGTGLRGFRECREMLLSHSSNLILQPKRCTDYIKAILLSIHRFTPKILISCAFGTFKTCIATGTATVWNWKRREER